MEGWESYSESVYGIAGVVGKVEVIRQRGDVADSSKSMVRALWSLSASLLLPGRQARGSCLPVMSSIIDLQQDASQTFLYSSIIPSHSALWRLQRVSYLRCAAVRYMLVPHRRLNA